MRTPALLGLALAALLLAGCATGPVSDGREPGGEPAPSEEVTVTGLAEVEITEYEGERLDSSADFRENSIKGPQDVEIATYRLKVGGLVEDPIAYRYSQITSGFPSYEKVVQLDCVEGWSAKVLWRGVLVRDILDASGVQAEAQSVIFRAADGYTTSFPVEYFYDNDIILAYAMNDVILRKDRGFPFQVVAEDKWGYKWCKWVTEIELSAEEDPGGYWEDRGYNNSGDRDRAFYGS